MGIFRVLFELFLLYLVYKLIFDFIVPLYQASVQVKNKMGQMQEKMNETLRQQQKASQGSRTFDATSKDKPSRPGKEDYIEFEELK